MNKRGSQNNGREKKDPGKYQKQRDAFKAVYTESE